MEKKQEEKKEQHEVTILDRTEIVVYPTPKTPQVQVLVTYMTPIIPPRTLTILKEEWSPEKEKELIKKDIEEQLKMKPEVYVV